MDLKPWLEARFGGEVKHCTPVTGGCIHRAWHVVRRDGSELFAKTNAASALPLLAAEAEGLVALAAAAPPELTVPLPLDLGVAGDQAVLVLPWLALGGAGPGSASWWQLGESLARLHRHSLAIACGSDDRCDGMVGWACDTWIGAAPQLNGWSSDWGLFFRDRRLAPQLERLARGGHRPAGAEALLALVPQWLAGHGAPACLVHGDLWSGNAGLLARGGSAIFDPAVHRGDREVDIAMAQLFGGFPAAFFEGYEQTWPLPAGHGNRAGLYNLYHFLNHANLFGGSYIGRVDTQIDRLLRCDW
ncbi:MAG: fructosamine kinase family protein [Cyanobacteriota bacterium]